MRNTLLAFAATALLIAFPALASAQSATQTTSQPAASSKTSAAPKAEPSAKSKAASTQPRDAKGRFMKKDTVASPTATNAKTDANAQKASAKSGSTQPRDAKGRFMSKANAAAAGANAKASTTGQGSSGSQAIKATESKRGKSDMNGKAKAGFFHRAVKPALTGRSANP